MADSGITGWIKRVLRPSSTRGIVAAITLGVVLGLLGVAGFNISMHVTATESFCLSCHEMWRDPYAQLKKTSHFNNASGVRPNCSDCHLPKEFFPKMERKIGAAREVWGNITGIIDTPEKYAAHAPAMKARELARMRANDSQECRNCHEVERMLPSAQSTKAKEYHLMVQSKGKTCIDCHAGIAHPQNFTTTAAPNN